LTQECKELKDVSIDDEKPPDEKPNQSKSSSEEETITFKYDSKYSKSSKSVSG